MSIEILERIKDGRIILPLRIEDTLDSDTGKYYWIVLDQKNTVVEILKSEVQAKGFLIRLEREK